MRELISCATCLRATRDWQQVTLQLDGVHAFSARCCRGCATEVEDVVGRLVRETRAAAVRS